jgi:DNA primase catalytic subunit|tara:strand:- start:406 stop:597 length:192 start_codon:yes stop_codon:yes gene_type:complete
MSDDLKEPKDLGIKIGSEDEVLWTRVKEESQSLIKQSENNLKIQREMLKLADSKIEIEKEKFK